MLAAFQQQHIRKFSPITNTSASRLNIQPNPSKISIAPSVISVIGIHMQKNKLKIKTGKSAGRAVVIVTTAEGKFRDLCVIHVQPYMTNPK
ncbi:hypothetical protein [Bacillus toyonensis]|uniref:BIG2 domain-containing protein n=1 Tax=Bacillus toyonensis TaxID=155322 RepID=A0A2C4QQ83_9BACI|nr:hypothetical protein [Bacillus toyonensis]PGB00624.1 hypothetical protein COL93_19630 [Bacillus toyonensis]PHD66681.1 hypothetical protein COF40_20920 [Bacillus toyonensis]